MELSELFGPAAVAVVGNVDGFPDGDLLVADDGLAERECDPVRVNGDRAVTSDALATPEGA